LASLIRVLIQKPHEFRLGRVHFKALDRDQNISFPTEFYLFNFNNLSRFGHTLGTKFCMGQYALKYSSKYPQTSPSRLIHAQSACLTERAHLPF